MSQPWPAGRTALIVSLVHAERPLSAQLADALRRGADAVELRLDRIGDHDAVRTLFTQPPPCPVILTLRSTAEGGEWDGDDSAGVALLEELGLLEPGVVDLEHRLWRRSANLRQKIGLVAERSDHAAPDGRSRNLLLLSHHDVAGTPDDAALAALFDRLADEPAALVKAVFTAGDATDALRVLAQVRRCAQRRPGVIGLAMGPAGLATRVLARKVGGAAVFAAADADHAAAPGQVAIETLRDVYRWDTLGPATRVLGVLGWPVGHSKGPWIHNAAMAAGGVDGVYLPLPVSPDYERFADFMDRVAAADWLTALGFSVTIPHKAHALRWLDARGAAVSDLARRCGAVNTLTRSGTVWRGDNTDVLGIQAALGAAAGQLRGAQALVLGAGGAARAAVVALADLGADVLVSNRTDARAAELARDLGCGQVPWEQRTAVRPRLLLNATSVGMAPDVAAAPMPPAALDAGTLVFETVYAPPETALLRAARAAGSAVVSGVQMFIAQAEAQYALWHAAPPARGVMQAALAAS